MDINTMQRVFHVKFATLEESFFTDKLGATLLLQNGIIIVDRYTNSHITHLDHKCIIETIKGLMNEYSTEPLNVIINLPQMCSSYEDEANLLNNFYAELNRNNNDTIKIYPITG